MPEFFQLEAARLPEKLVKSNLVGEIQTAPNWQSLNVLRALR